MDIEIINADIKDKILFYLCTNCVVEEMSEANIENILKEIETSYETLNGVMKQFERMNLIEDYYIRRPILGFTLLTEAHDFANKGGFKVTEEILETNISKLLLEIESLKKELEPDKLEILNKLSAIASALFGGLSLIKK